MKKFITYLVVAVSWSYYACMPFVVAKAQAPAVNGTAKAAKVLYMRVTAYTSVPNETDSTPFTTADGARVRDGIVASNILPFGTKIQIPALFGNKVFTVEDRTSPKFSQTIDLWMSSVKQALHFGVAHAYIVVLGKGSADNLAVAAK